MGDGEKDSGKARSQQHVRERSSVFHVVGRVEPLKDVYSKYIQSQIISPHLVKEFLARRCSKFTI